MNLIFALGIMLLSGLIAALLIEKIKLPYVTGYIIMGIIIGPYVLNLIPKTFLRNTDIIANFVLSIVAFMISRNFSYSVFKKTGKQIIFVSMFEASCAWLFVTLGVFLLLHKPLYIALLFGALAAATDPASILLVSRQYRTKGLIGTVYIGMRFVRKYLRASIGAFLSKAPKTVRKFVGLGLVPQAGIALGMAILGKGYFLQAEEIT